MEPPIMPGDKTPALWLYAIVLSLGIAFTVSALVGSPNRKKMKKKPPKENILIQFTNLKKIL